MSIFGIFSMTQIEPISRKPVNLEENIILRIAEDDMEAFRILYEKTDKAVFGFLLSILNNRYDAEDVMQETYLRIRASAHLYQPKGKPMAWIFTIARNLALMKLRKDKPISLTDFEELRDSIGFSEITNVEDRMVLESAFQILNENERQILIMHAVTGLKHREIARILDMPLSSVLSKYRRSLGKLKKYLTEQMKLEKK